MAYENEKKETSMPNVSMRHKKKSMLKLPTGAKELSRTVNVEVEEIENGYLIEKRVEVKYQMPNKDYSDYTSCCYKYYTKECPIKMDTKNKELADLFDES